MSAGMMLSRNVHTNPETRRPPGASVLIEELADGELRILPTDKVRQQVRQIADRVVREHPEAIKILAGHA